MNCLSLTYKHFSFLPGEELKSFFQFCKEHKLHKPVNEESTSRLHSIYNYEEICNGAEAIVAYEGTLPVAISFVEAREQSAEFANNMISLEKSPVYNLGFAHFYVNPIYRNLGIASDLATHIEKQCLKKALKEHSIAENTIIFFVAQEDAFNLIQKNTDFTYAVKSDMKHRHRQMELNLIKEDIDNNTSIKKSLDKLPSSLKIKENIQNTKSNLKFC